MRLFSRLVVSHAAPVMVVSVALALVLGSIGRMTQLVRELGDDELGTLAREGTLHEADWNLDLSMRHAVHRCASGDAGAATEAIARHAAVLRERLRATPSVSPGLERTSQGYLALADRVLGTDVCAELRGAAEADRAELDAAITTIWVERLGELHAAAREREANVARLGTIALIAGVLVACVAFAFALWTARRMALEISAPLRKISDVAQHLARGDFGAPLTAEGPVEIVELAEVLEQTRVRLAQLESLKQGFLASVSHELRTPLSKIREALALLGDGACGPLGERQARVVGIAQTACEREIRIVTTLLDLSRLRAGTPLRRRAGASMDEVLSTAVAEEEPEARSRGVRIEVERSGEVGRTSLDEALLERAFANLVRNAVAVSKSGQTVHVSRTVGEHRGRPAAMIRVRDEGPGVPDEVRETLFEPFVTVAVGGSPKALGIGLGLALAREVARAHGGELELEDGASRGTTFVLRLPLADRASLPPPAPSSAAFGVLGVRS